MPIVRISQSIKAMAVGERLRVEANDPAFSADLEAWSKRTGHTVLEFHGGSVQGALIEKR